MVQSALSWDKNVLEPVFRELYTQAQEGMKDYIGMMYDIQPSTKAVESIEMIGGEGLMEEWSHSNNQVYYSDVNELWQKYFTPGKFSDGRQIDRDFIDDLKLTAIKDRITSLAQSEYYTRQAQAAEWFVNGDKTTGVDFRGRSYDSSLPDKKALFATDHPLAPGDTGPGQSNKGTDELTIDAFDDTVVAMQAWTNDRGNLLPVMPDTLIVAPYNRRAALQIAGISGKGEGYEPGSADHNINIYEGDIKVIVNPFFTKGNRKAWIAADSRRMKRAMKWFERRRPENGSMTDFDTEIAKYKVVGRWSKGCIDWTWGFGHFPV
ncbi:Mu-like prophage major head subunit gpT family protein [Paenibacillus polymyxa]|uniref:Mu-like prophage major head subunit gpT family protein n=1 Tax=Paenibacillus polymyxa TaxID=1406 RepID=UPI002377D484|nr:Mu-like prophage major head subunit gpT family protein [Paenibacillus polymyxa]WDM22644.1 Mu-like prophage major head subunit gpT family protein [Paenibacillus polymyxa]